jgi:apolipoprotein D and lipocalin family protein
MHAMSEPRSRSRHRRPAAFALLVASALSVGGCTTGNRYPPLPTVAHVDLARYQGTWHEIARLPMWFQRGCIRSTATYALRDDGTVSVINRCSTDDGGEKVAVGRAFVVDAATNARLEVEFDNLFSRLLPGVARGDYWIIHLEPDYSLAIVGHPSRDYLWILARDAEIDAARYDAAVELTRRLGFPVDELVRAPAAG